MRSKITDVIKGLLDVLAKEGNIEVWSYDDGIAFPCPGSFETEMVKEIGSKGRRVKAVIL